VGTDDDETAANLAAAINASATALVAKHVVATSAAAVVTITAKQGGHSGNAITISSPDTTITASEARLEDGDDGDTETTHYFGSAS
jgi:phage tail sheath gpL-like